MWPFKKPKQNATYKTTINLIGGECPPFGCQSDILGSDLVRACVAANANHTSKAKARVIRKTDSGIVRDDANTRLERLLDNTPNPYMNGRDFLYKVRALCDIKGTSFVLIDRSLDGSPAGYYPVDYASSEAIVSKDGMSLLGFRFHMKDGKVLTARFDDLMILRRDYMRDSYFGESPTVLYKPLDMLMIADKGLENAIRMTSNLRGILQSTKAMVDTPELRRLKDEFVRDYVNMQNESGIASLDAMSTFTPVNMEPKSATAQQITIYEKRIMRFFGVNDNILMNSYSDEQWSAYYEGSIEPFLIALSLEAANKSFTDRERGFGNDIIYESNRLQYASNQVKLSIVSLVDRGIISPNEYREILNMGPVEGGDVYYIRREYTKTENLNNEGE